MPSADTLAAESMPAEFLPDESAVAETVAIPAMTRSEAAELADVLGIRPEAMQPIRLARSQRGDTSAPADYDRLVADPIKAVFSRSGEFFHERKAEIAIDCCRRLLPSRRLQEVRLLDVGCGTGQLLRLLARRFGHVRGCDPSSGMVRQAGRRAIKMPSPMEVPFADCSFDVAVCACVYHHVDSASRLAHVRETARVVRPGGLVMIFEHNPRNPITRRIVARCPIDESAVLIGRGEMAAILQAAGLVVEWSRSYLFLPRGLYRWIGGIERVLGLTGLGGQYCIVARKPM